MGFLTTIDEGSSECILKYSLEVTEAPPRLPIEFNATSTAELSGFESFNS